MSSESDYSYVNPKPRIRAHIKPLTQMDQFPHILAQYYRGYRKEGRNVGEASDDRECLSIFEDRARSEEEVTRLQTDCTYDMLPTGGDAKPSDDASNHRHNHKTCQMCTKIARSSLKRTAVIPRKPWPQRCPPRRSRRVSMGLPDPVDAQTGVSSPYKLERNEPDSALRCSL